MPTKILVIDDDALLIKVMESRLTSSGYEVITASDGQDGLAKARAIKPDLIILDVMLPKMDGFRIAQFLKLDDQYKHIPIMMFTGRVMDEDKETGLQAGADAYIDKTFKPEELIAKIEELLGKKPSA